MTPIVSVMTESDVSAALQRLDEVDVDAANTIRAWMDRMPRYSELVDDLRTTASTIRNHAHTLPDLNKRRELLVLADRLSRHATDLLDI